MYEGLLFPFVQSFLFVYLRFLSLLFFAFGQLLLFPSIVDSSIIIDYLLTYSVNAMPRTPSF